MISPVKLMIVCKNPAVDEFYKNIKCHAKHINGDWQKYQQRYGSLDIERSVDKWSARFIVMRPTS